MTVTSGTETFASEAESFVRAGEDSRGLHAGRREGWLHKCGADKCRVLHIRKKNGCDDVHCSVLA